MEYEGWKWKELESIGESTMESRRESDGKRCNGMEGLGKRRGVKGKGDGKGRERDGKSEEEREEVGKKSRERYEKTKRLAFRRQFGTEARQNP
jgi:hypothetical protein